MSKIMKRNISWLLLCTMGVTNVMPTMAKPIVTVKMNLEENQEDLSSIGVVEMSPIDIYLTVGESKLNVSNFKNDVLKEFENMGVDTSKINIKAIETSNVNISNAFTWNQNVNSTIGSIAILNSGSSLTMKGNTTKAGKNAIWTFPTIPGKQDFSVNYSINYGDSFNGAGILLKVKKEGNNLKGYMLSFNNSGVFSKSAGTGSVWKFTYPLNQNTVEFSASQVTKIANLNINTSGTLNFITSNKDIKISGGGLSSPVVIATDSSWSDGDGFGFFSDHYSHNCSNIGQFTLNNIGLKITESKTFSELIREPKWNDQSKRFVVNLNEKVDNDFEDSAKLSEILTKTLNENIHYIGWGNDVNKKQNEKFISNNNNQGIVLDDSDYKSSITKIVEYIVDQLETTNPDTNSLLAGSQVEVQVYPEELKESSANESNPYGRWRTIHDYEYFENNEGQAPFSELYQDALDVSFDKPGKYDIFFDGEIVKTLIVHRQPVANYQTRLMGLNLDIAEDSFDVDKISEDNQGVVNKEWKWKETTEEDWHMGLPPTTLEANKDYVIQLRVQDEQETWSNPTTKYVSTRDIQSTPIAEFSIKNTSFTKYQTLEITNNSYDPTGKSIGEQEWTLKKSNLQVYKGSVLPTNFNTTAYGEGEYSLSLRVKNANNTWSESYTRYFTVTKDITAPELTIDRVLQTWTTNDIQVNIESFDKGGSELVGSRFLVSNSNKKPSEESVWSEWTPDSNFDVSIEDEGTHFIHIESKDNEGNLTYRAVGPYQIDRSGPVVTHKLNNSDLTNTNVMITIQANDDLSSTQSILLPDCSIVENSQATYEVEQNGTYVFTAIDNVGNKSVYEVEVTNIDKTLPNITHNLSNDTWTNEYIDIHLTGDKEYGRIILPDGEFVMGTETTYRVYDNGDYTFKLGDFAGNEVSYTVSIDNFDRVKPEGSFMINQDTTKWVHDRNVVLNLDFIDEGVGIDYIDISETYEKPVPKIKIIETHDEIDRTTSAAINLDLRHLAVLGIDDEMLNDSTNDKEDVSFENDLDSNLDEPNWNLETDLEEDLSGDPEKELPKEVEEVLENEPEQEYPNTELPGELEEELENEPEEEYPNSKLPGELEEELENEPEEEYPNSKLPGELEEELENEPEEEYPNSELPGELEEELEEEFDTILVSQSKRIDVRDNAYTKDVAWMLSEGLGLKSFTVRVVDILGNTYTLESDVTLVEAPAAPGLGDTPVIMPTPDEPEETPDVPVIPNEPETTPGDDILDDKDNDADNDIGNNDDDNDDYDDYYYIVSKKPSINNTNKDKNINKENEVIEKNETIKPLEISYVIFTEGVKNYVVDNKVVLADSSPILKDGRIYLPIRHLSNALNITNDNIKWLPETRQVIIHDGHDELTLRVGDKYAILNGVRMEMDGSAFIEGDRVFVPISQIKEVFKSRSLEVDWMESSKQAVISFKKQ